MKRLVLVCLSSTAAVILTAPLQARAQEPAAATPAVAPAQPTATPAEPGLRIVAEANSKEPVVSIAFDETPLNDVIKTFRDATGANIISGGTNLQGVVSVRLDNVPWRKGLSAILDLQGMQLLEQPAGSEIYVVSPKQVIEIPKIIKTFALDYAKAEDISGLFSNILAKTSRATPYKEANAVVVAATEQELGECETILKSIDKTSPQISIEVRFVELSANASKKLGMKWDTLKEWGATVHSIEGGMEYNNGKLGHYKTGTTTVRPSASILPGTGVNGADGKFIEPVYRNEVVDETWLPSDFPSASMTTPLLNAGGAGRSKEDMAWHTARGIGGQLSVDGFRLAMSAFEQLDGASVFSNPKIIVANEKEALVDMTTKEPNLTVTTTRSGTSSDQIDIAARLELIPGSMGDKDGKGKGLYAGEAFFSYGIVVKVIPRISPSGLITVNIEPSISDKVGTYDFGTETGTPTPKYPIIFMQRLQTVFTMQDGETAVIGGLTRTTEGTTDSGIPGLRKLPWVGPRIFGWKGRDKQQKEIIIFVTVALADPLNMAKDVAMPKNAILGRDLISGVTQEPGDRTTEEVMSLSDKVMQQDRSKTPASVKVVPETAEPATAAPVAVAPATAATAAPMTVAPATAVPVTAVPETAAQKAAEPVTSEREAVAPPKDEPAAKPKEEAVAKPKEEPITPLLKDN